MRKRWYQSLSTEMRYSRSLGGLPYIGCGHSLVMACRLWKRGSSEMRKGAICITGAWKSTSSDATGICGESETT